MSDIDASGISLRDDGLEANALGILNSCSLMPHLVHLDLSGANFTSLKRSTKHQGTLTSIVLALVKLFGDENSVSTSIASKKSHTVVHHLLLRELLLWIFFN